MKHYVIRLHHHFVRLPHNAQKLLIVFGIVGIGGTIAVLVSHAALFSPTLEPENAERQGTDRVTDSTASGGASIRFGAPTFYVGPNGNDDADGTARAPWRTIQKAVDTAAARSIIKLADGTYAPFKVTRPDLTVTGTRLAVVTGAAGVQNVVEVKAANVILRNFSVTGCVPDDTPPGGFEQTGSAQVRISQGGDNVLVDKLSVHDSHGINSDGLPFGCYGIFIHKAAGTIVSNNEIYHNAGGVNVYGGGSGIIIRNNIMHDNDVIIRNTIANNNDDYGGTAMGVGYTTTANPGPVIRDNLMYRNFGPSHDYKTDGGATEIYASTNVTFDHNIMHDNDVVFESGTGGGKPCNNNKFINNTAYGKAADSTVTMRTPGMFVRCGIEIDGNTFRQLNWYAIVVTDSDVFGGSLNGLKITNNTFDQSLLPGRTTSEATITFLQNPAGKNIIEDYNRYRYIDTFGKDWNGKFVHGLGAWRALTGFDTHSTVF